MKFKYMEEVGAMYRSLFGIFRTGGKLPVFENTQEFDKYFLQTELAMKKAIKELYNFASEEDKQKYGERAILRKCEKTIKAYMGEDVDEIRWRMLNGALHCNEKIAGLKEGHYVDEFNRKIEYFIGLFVNENLARECQRLMVEHGLTTPEQITLLNNVGEPLEDEDQKEA